MNTVYQLVLPQRIIVRARVVSTVRYVVFGIAIVLLSSTANAVPIVTNGDFEAGFSGWTKVLVAGTGGSGSPYGGATSFNANNLWDNGSTSVLGTGGNVGWIEVFQAVSTVSSLQQSVSLAAGSYQLTYEVNSRQIVSGGSQPYLEVLIDGTTLLANQQISQVNAQGVSTNLFHAFIHTFSVPMTGSYLLDFKVSEDGTDKDQTMLFDNIAITSIPEPMSLTLFGIGSVVMIIARRARCGGPLHASL